jgi:hypothetical protein
MKAPISFATTSPTDQCAKASPVSAVRAVIGWVLENDRQFRHAQNMVENSRRGR